MGTRVLVSAQSGIPGAGYQQSVGGKRTAAPAPEAPAQSSKPGLFAPKGEKALYKAIKAQDAAAIRAIGMEHEDYRLISYSLADLMLLDEDFGSAESPLDEAFAQGAIQPRSNSPRSI